MDVLRRSLTPQSCPRRSLINVIGYCCGFYHVVRDNDAGKTSSLFLDHVSSLTRIPMEMGS
jgi:hypothetical protein